MWKTLVIGEPAAVDWRGMYIVAIFHLRAEQFDRTLPGVMHNDEWMPATPYYQAMMIRNARRLRRFLGLEYGQVYHESWKRHRLEIGRWKLPDLERFVEICEREHDCAPPEHPRPRASPPVRF